VPLLEERWRGVAEENWAPGADGQSPGRLIDMTPPGVEYDVLTRTYMTTETKPVGNDPRPWQRIEGEPLGPMPEDPQDLREEDWTKIVDFFQKDGDEPAPGGTIVDVGCGTGFMASRLARSRLFDRVFAFDVDWRALEAARSVAEQANLSPEAGLFMLRGDVQEVPFQAGQIDFAWWGMGLHRVRDQQKALTSLATALRPGGRLLATTVASVAAGRTKEDIVEKALEAGFTEATVEQPRMSEFVLRAVK